MTFQPRRASEAASCDPYAVAARDPAVRSCPWDGPVYWVWADLWELRSDGPSGSARRPPSCHGAWPRRSTRRERITSRQPTVSEPPHHRTSRNNSADPASWQLEWLTERRSLVDCDRRPAVPRLVVSGEERLDSQLLRGDIDR